MVLDYFDQPGSLWRRVREEITMPDRDVKTVKDQIFFHYAKIIAYSAFDHILK